MQTRVFNIQRRQIIFLPAFILLYCCKNNGNHDYFVRDVSSPVISLNGAWKININPPQNFWETDQLNADWKEIQVPGECMMQGIPVRHDQPFAYKKSFEIPADYKDKLIKLRFEGVYSYARVWVNGKFIRDHSGGFTAWECDITSAVNPGQTSMLTVEVTDRADEISYASGYAKHQIGGILRNVSLLALPENYPENINIITDLDENFANALLVVKGKLYKPGKGNSICLELFDATGNKIELPNSSLNVMDTVFKIENPIANPVKWDAEHPNLYRLKVSFPGNNKPAWIKYYSIGFREIEVKGNKFLVNGKPVKLRGACHHDIHPTLGRVSTPEYELMDITFAKEANINFIRTSHYPPTENFLKLCDEYGIYVEDETAVCFVGSHRTAEYYPGSSESEPGFTSRYLSQLSEMVDNHRNHPSVIIWSIGNENVFGGNFKKSYDWVKDQDPTRPVIFSYPGNVPDSIKAYDILSMHYPGLNGMMEQYGKSTASFGNKDIPVIFDEWAHVPCYNNFTVKEDPNIRDFWGIGLDSMWQKTYDANGGLGGAIWGMIDETFMLPENLPGYNEWWGKIDKNIIPSEYTGHTVGYGEWGIVDTWRRKKPEFWNTKKAYSPVRILKTSYDDFKPGDTIVIPVYNRFDHTNLNELTIKYSYKGTSNSIKSPDIPPHSKGEIRIILNHWAPLEPLMIDFIDFKDRLIDSYALHITLDSTEQHLDIAEGNVDMAENATQYIITCENGVNFQINKSTGLFSNFKNSLGTISFSGPLLNLRTLGKSISYSTNEINDYGRNWKLKSVSARKENNTVILLLKGDYQNLRGVEFTIHIFPDAAITTEYLVPDPPKEYIREIGIKYFIDDKFDSISWKRNTYWSVYPAAHLSAPEGKVSLYGTDLVVYRKAPSNEWVYDTRSFYYEGTDIEKAGKLTRIAKSTKENITEYILFNKNGQSVMVNGTGKEGCRIDKSGNRIGLYINNALDYPDIGWGDFQRNILSGKNYSGKIRLTINNP